MLTHVGMKDRDSRFVVVRSVFTYLRWKVIGGPYTGMGKLCSTNETQRTKRLTHWKSLQTTELETSLPQVKSLWGTLCPPNSWIMEHAMKNYIISQFCVKWPTNLIVESAYTSTGSTAIPCPYPGPWAFHYIFSLLCSWGGGWQSFCRHLERRLCQLTTET